MITFPRLDAMCRGVIPFCREKKMHLDTHAQGEQTATVEINLSTTLVIHYLWGEVDIGSSVEQQLSYVQVFIVCSNVEGCESSLQGHIRVSTCHSQRTPHKDAHACCTCTAHVYNHIRTHAYLAEYIRIGVILQKHCGCACVVVACCNVQRRKADLSLGAVVDEQGYDILMSLLKSHGERSESILQHTGES